MRTIGRRHPRRADSRKRADAVGRLAYASPLAWVLLICTTSVGAEVAIPAIGQPSPFYGAAGKGVKVETTASPTELTLDGAIHYTIRVSNLLNAAEVERPDLAAIEAFQRNFQIEDEPITEAEPPGVRIFRYRLRPRQTATTAIPGLVFPYYDPSLPQPPDKPDFPFLRARTQAIPIRIRKATPPPLPVVPLEVPAFAESLAEPSTAVPEWAWWLALAGPPIAAVAWCVVWRAMNPVGDRLARRRQSRAARLALRTLHSFARQSSRDPAAIVGCVALYLAERFDLPGVYRTPADLAIHLRNAGASDEVVAQSTALARAADAVRFAPSPAGSADVLIADGERLIRGLEGEA